MTTAKSFKDYNAFKHTPYSTLDTTEQGNMERWSPTRQPQELDELEHKWKYIVEYPKGPQIIKS